MSFSNYMELSSKCSPDSAGLELGTEPQTSPSGMLTVLGTDLTLNSKGVRLLPV